VAYTGTHDNNTTLDWLKSLEGEEKKMVKFYLKGRGRKALKNAIEIIWSSTANTGIIPMQDMLEMGAKARMNTPGVANGNWDWRFQWKQLKNRQKVFIQTITEKYNRCK
ncbi:MAG TPA: 4-alpha-glucanotransferase, partial [Draconibacterium sp.]|nr:4-alpha-glucanotransferase [Draconibacterium sp.]